MATPKKTKIKKPEQSTQLPLDDERWRPVAEIIERVFPYTDKILIAQDLTKALASKKIRCMRRSTQMGHYPFGHRELLPASFWAEHR
jgi:hypothetical protein